MNFSSLYLFKHKLKLSKTTVAKLELFKSLFERFAQYKRDFDRFNKTKGSMQFRIFAILVFSSYQIAFIVKYLAGI